MPGSVTSIEPGAFLNCRNLTSVTLPAGLQSIGAQAFKTVPIAASPAFVFPDGLLSIGPSAFESCGELTVVSIPSSVNSIGTAAFAACNKLTAINVA
ncbi:MAG: leucine-rich repeat domain-containing protein [Christensenellales bacterium]